MAGSIKGITIEFRGDTTKLDSALRNINNETKKLDQELRNVDKALKFNPTSVELWQQKQQILTEKIEKTKEKLDALKQAQAKMDAEGVDKNSEEYRKLQREIIETESKLKTFEGQLKKIGNVNLRAASEQFKEMGNKLQSAGQAMQGLSMAAAAVTAAIGALTVKSGKWADDLNTMSKQYSLNTQELQLYSAAADLVDVSVDAIAKSHLKLEKSMSSAAKGTGASAEAFEKLGVSVTDSNGNLRDGDEVWQDTIKALGQVTNETERDALAMQLMGKSASELNPLIEDGGETYKNVADTMAKYHLDFIDQETLDKANQFNDELDTMKMIGSVALQTIGTQLAGYLAPALEKVVEVVGRVAEWLTSLSPQTQTIIAAIAAAVAVLAPLLIGLGKVSFAISSILSLMATVGPAIGGVLAAMGPIALVIAAVVAAGVLLYKNWDTIKAKAIELKNKLVETWNNIKTAASTAWNAVKDAVLNAVKTLQTSLSNMWNTIKTTATTAWNNIKSAITKPIETAKDTIKGIIEKIKGFFPVSIGNVVGHLKLPHFKLTGKFSIVPPSVPKFSVSWYKKGGIFDSPSLIGIGEAGPEAVVPLDKLWEKLDNIQGETNIVINVNGANASPMEIAEEVKRVLIRETNQRRLAWQ